eukprot:153350-Amphidinium_carterae.1
MGEQFMNPDHLPSCAFCGTFHEVVGCNYEGCSLGWCPSHLIYVSGVGGGFWCLKHKDNIPLEHEYSIIQRPLGCARTYCVTCHTEVWPTNKCQHPDCLAHFCELHFVMHEKGLIKLTWCTSHEDASDRDFKRHTVDKSSRCMSCGTPSTNKCGICPEYMCKNCHCYVSSADTWSGFTFACLSHGGSPRMVYEKARFARVKAYTPSIHRHDPMFPRNFGPFNE